MEIFFGLTAIVLATIALWRTKKAGENNEQLTDRLTEVELEVYRLRQKNSGSPATPAAKTAPIPMAEPDIFVPPPPVIPEMPIPTGIEEIAPGVFGEADSRPISPPPVLAFAKTVGAAAAGAENVGVARLEHVA